MTTFAASVTIVDLPVGTTVGGTELLEAVQTVGGVGQSVQLSVNQIMAFGGLPLGGATGTILNKSSAASFSTQFSAINTFVLVGGNLMTSGLVTSITVDLATNAKVTGTFGVLGTASFSGGIVATGTLGQIGTATVTGAFNVVGTAAFTGAFNVNGTTIQTGAFVLGSQGTGILISSSTGLISAQNNAVGTAQLATSAGHTGSLGVGIATGLVSGGTTAFGVSFSSVATFGVFCGTGVPTISAGTGSLYLRNDGTTATTRMYVNINGTGTWTGVNTVA